LKIFKKKEVSKTSQYVFSILIVLFVATSSYFFKTFLGFRVVALLLLVTVSLLAMVFDILPVLIASTLSALIWNFFFIPPIFTLHIDNTEDVLMFFMYFIIASVNAVLTFKIREQEKKVRDKDEKEKSIKLYNTLLNSLSHELRTPISTILGAIDTLKENKQKISEENQEVLLNEMAIAGLRLNRQVENLLNISRLESSNLKPNFIWSDMNEILYSIIDSFKFTKEAHEIIYHPNETLPLIKIDNGFIEQIINNLISNALHHTHPNTTIIIEVFVENDICLIEIADNGGGIPEDKIDLVFEKFYRLPNSKSGGTGLGLSIVKGYIQALGGNISLANNAKGGVTFTIAIPSETSYINSLKNE